MKNKDKIKIVISPEYSASGVEEILYFKDKKELSDYLEKMAYDVEEKEIIDVLENGGKYEGLNHVEFEVFLPEKEEEKTPFNDAELFVNEFEEYLKGMSLTYGKGEKFKIKSISFRKGKAKQLIEIETDKEDYISAIDIQDAQSFIDGEEVQDIINNGEEISLLIQDESKNTSPNKPEYKYYVVNLSTMKILSGNEYQEEAKENFDKLNKYGTGQLSIQPKKELSKLNLNPDESSNWSLNEHDWEVIKRALNSRIKSGDFSEREAEMYLKEFKEKGNFNSVIKASMIMYLSDEQRKTRSAYMTSNLERIAETCDETCRIQKELKRIIANEK